MEAFAYVWTDHQTKKLYVGTHKGSPNDGYICSGKFMLEEYNTRPEDFTRQIIASGTYEDMIVFESSILRACNAKKDPLMYNQHNGDGKFYNSGHTEETKVKLKIARNKRTDKPNFGNTHNEETRKVMSEKAKEAAKVDGRGRRLAENRGKGVDYSQITKEVWRKRREGLLPYPNHSKDKK
jgi:hypothetical protein